MLVIVCSVINEANLNRKNNVFVHIFSALLIITVPAILAGLRDYSVGTDINVYAVPVFKYAISANSISTLMQMCKSSYLGSIEYGFLTLAYCVSRFTINAGWFLFFISLFIQTLVYLALYRTRNISSITLGEIVFLFLFYNESLNLMRQYMAMSVLLYALTFILIDKNYFKYIIGLIVAYLFHRSSIIGVIFIPLFLYFDNKNESINSEKLTRYQKIKFWIRLIFICIGVVFVSSSFDVISNMLISGGLLSNKYLNYLNGNYSGLSLKVFVYYALLVIPIFLNRNRNRYGYAYLSIFLCDLILYPLRGVMPWLYRVCVYFMYVRIFSVSSYKSNLLKIISCKKINRQQILIIISIIFCIIYWCFFVLYWNNNETLPYIFKA